jgi:hypothetical protein
MKHLLILLPLGLISVPVSAQQITEFNQCVKTREIYVPGYYDNYGNYMQGSVRTERYTVNCENESVVTNQYQSGINCRATPAFLGALLGGGVAASMSRGDGYAWSVPVGAAIGGAIFGCN